MLLQDGPMAGREVDVPLTPRLVLPSMDGDGQHFAEHHYDHTGHWLKSQTFVGYESDETRRKREQFWEREYWYCLESDADRSFV